MHQGFSGEAKRAVEVLYISYGPVLEFDPRRSCKIPDKDTQGYGKVCIAFTLQKVLCLLGVSFGLSFEVYLIHLFCRLSRDPLEGSMKIRFGLLRSLITLHP